MTKRKCVMTVAISVFLFVLCPTLRADGVSVSISGISGTPGSSVDVIGTITNNTDGTVYLNGDNFTLSDPSLSLDDTDFFLNAPLTLAANASSGPFDIFVIDISSSATPGVLAPNFFSVLGGTDGGSFDQLGTAQFTVNVKAASPVPEPSSIFLLVAGLALLWFARRQRSFDICAH